MAFPEVHLPGDDSPPVVDVAGEASDVDAAVVAASQGKARRIKKHGDAPPFVPEVADPERPMEAGVNAKVESDYDAAVRKSQAGELKRPVLTSKGWVVPENLPAPKQPVGR